MNCQEKGKNSEKRGIEEKNWKQMVKNEEEAEHRNQFLISFCSAIRRERKRGEQGTNPERREGKKRTRKGNHLVKNEQGTECHETKHKSRRDRNCGRELESHGEE